MEKLGELFARIVIGVPLAFGCGWLFLILIDRPHGILQAIFNPIAWAIAFGAYIGFSVLFRKLK